jgi:hypothetical protein
VQLCPLVSTSENEDDCTEGYSQTLTPHANPNGPLNILFSRTGYMTPPMDEPVASTPRAVARRVVKKWEIEETAGRKMIPAAS